MTCLVDKNRNTICIKSIYEQVFSCLFFHLIMNQLQQIMFTILFPENNIYVIIWCATVFCGNALTLFQ